MTQDEIADLVGVTPGVVSQILNGSVKASRHLAPIFRACGLPEYLLWNTDTTQRKWLRALDTLRAEASAETVSSFTARLERLIAEEIEID